MAFANDYILTDPDGSEAASTIDDIIKEMKNAINERLELEHYFVTSGSTEENVETSHGRHEAGKVGVLKKDTAANILNISGAGEGAFAWAEDTGDIYRYSIVSGWEVVPFASALVAGLGIELTGVGTTINCDIADAADLAAGTANKMVDAALLKGVVVDGIVKFWRYGSYVQEEFNRISRVQTTYPVINSDFTIASRAVNEYLDIVYSLTIVGISGGEATRNLYIRITQNAINTDILIYSNIGNTINTVTIAGSTTYISSGTEDITISLRYFFTDASSQVDQLTNATDYMYVTAKVPTGLFI